MHLTTAIRNSRLAAIKTALDADMPMVMEVLDGTGTVLVRFADLAMSTPTLAASAFTATSSLGLANGDPASYRVKGHSGTIHLSGTAGIGAGEAALDGSVVQDALVSLESFTISEGNV